MQIFYIPDIEGDICSMDENESKHCVRVLRMGKGDHLNIIDGRGNLYDGVIKVANPKACQVLIANVIKNYEKRSYRLSIAISPVKNQERFEWFVEKSVEFGIDEITPLICTNTEKASIKKERINNIITSAMKQSLKASRPVLNDPVDFKQIVLSDFQGTTMIAHCNASFARKRISEIYVKGSNALIMIGPEGDFTEDELNFAIASGFSPIHLGSSRLRTETAGIAACHSIYFINQQ